MDLWTDADADRVTGIIHDLKMLGHFLNYQRGGISGRRHILCLLYDLGGTASQRELGERFGMKAATLSEVLAKMQNDGLVERTRDDEDSRKLWVRLTEKGAQAGAEEIENRKRFQRRCMASLTVPEQEELLRLLDRLRADWETIDD